MIIGVDIREWQPGIRTGIGRFLEEFLGTAAVLRPQDHFLLIGDSSCEIRVHVDNVRTIRIPEWWTPWWDQVALARALARSGADVFYSPFIKVPLLTRIPVVSTIHDLTFFIRRNYNRYWTDHLLNPPFRLFCYAAVRRAAAIIVDSAASARDVERLLSADSKKLHVVSLATSSAFRPCGEPAADADVWTRYGLAQGYVLYVGSFWPHKNVPQIVRAHAALPQELRRNHPLVLAGGSPSDTLDHLLQEPSVALAARYVGVVPDSDLPALYRGAALFVFPSHYEGFGLPVLEAMASGVPVLCSSTPALVELVSDAADQVDAENGPEWERALRALLEDPIRRAALSARGLARSALFSPERMTQGILTILDEIVERRW